MSKLKLGKNTLVIMPKRQYKKVKNWGKGAINRTPADYMIKTIPNSYLDCFWFAGDYQAFLDENKKGYWVCSRCKQKYYSIKKHIFVNETEHYSIRCDCKKKENRFFLPKGFEKYFKIDPKTIISKNSKFNFDNYVIKTGKYRGLKLEEIYLRDKPFLEEIANRLNGSIFSKFMDFKYGK